MSNKLISVVTPAHNEEKNLTVFCNKVKEIFSQSKILNKYDFEIIMTDDGSTDGTWDEIVTLGKKDKRYKGIHLSRNFGHQIALTAGLDKAQGNLVIYCDSDLQHPPRIFPKLVKKWEQGFKVVHTNRLKTAGEPALKKFLSNKFYKAINKMSTTKIMPGMADFKLIDKKVLFALKEMREKDRFLRGMVPWLGFKSTVINFKADKRLHGVPSYNFKKNLFFARTAILSFSTKPLEIIGYIGFLLMLFSAFVLFLGLSFSLLRWKLFFSPIFFVALLNTFLMGLVLLCMGIIALYVSNIKTEVMNRPTYLIAEESNL